MSPSSWMATGDGPPSAGFRRSPDTARVPRRCAKSSPRPSSSASTTSRSTRSPRRTGAGPEDEVSGLMRLFIEVLEREVNNLMRMNVRVEVIGVMAELPTATREAFERICAKTAENTGLTLGRGAELRRLALRFWRRRAALAPTLRPARSIPRPSTRAVFAVAVVHRRDSRPRPARPHQRRVARQQLPALADRLQRTVDHQASCGPTSAGRTSCVRSSTTRSATDGSEDGSD